MMKHIEKRCPTPCDLAMKRLMVQPHSQTTVKVKEELYTTSQDEASQDDEEESTEKEYDKH